MFALLSLHCSLLSRLNKLGFLDKIYRKSSNVWSPKHERNLWKISWSTRLNLVHSWLVTDVDWKVLQTNAFVAVLAVHSAKYCLLRLRQCLHPPLLRAMDQCPAPSLGLSQTSCSPLVAEFANKILGEFNTKCQLCSGKMVNCFFLQNERVHNSHIQIKPEKVAPPLSKHVTSGLITVKPIVQISSSHTPVAFHFTLELLFRHILYSSLSRFQLDYFGCWWNGLLFIFPSHSNNVVFWAKKGLLLTSSPWYWVCLWLVHLGNLLCQAKCTNIQYL